MHRSRSSPICHQMSPSVERPFNLAAKPSSNWRAPCRFSPSPSRSPVSSARPHSSQISKNDSTSQIDWELVDKEPPQVGVKGVMAARLRLDATMSPAMLDLRMNRQNLLNEMKHHQGKVVSHQFALMRPRRRATVRRPRDLEPHGYTKAFEKFGRMSTRSMSNGTLVGVTLAIEEDNQTKDVCKADPRVTDAVQRLMKDEKLKSVFFSVEEEQGKGMSMQRVPRALKALGFEPDAKLIEASLEKLMCFSPSRGKMHLSLEEFAVVVEDYQTHRVEELRRQFTKLDADNSGTINAREFRHLLWDKGFTVSMDEVSELMQEVDDDESGQIDFHEFEAAVQLVSKRYGFTKSEVDKLYKIFDRYDHDNSEEISADELASALGWFGTPTTIAQAEDLINRFDQDGDGTLGKSEFLMVMRHRLEKEITEMRALFSEFDKDDSGNLSAAELSDMLQKLGYTVPINVIEEGFSELGYRANAALVFEDVHRLFKLIQQREGFSKEEAQELGEVFKRFVSIGAKDIREFELSRALMWLGYPIAHYKRHQLWVKVDTDKTGTIDHREFLKLVRLLREEENKAAQSLLRNHKETLQLREKDLKDMLHKLGYAPDNRVLQEGLAQSIDSDHDGLPDFSGIVQVLRFIREAETTRLRQSAGLPDRQAAKVRSRFHLKQQAGKRMEVEDFERFMYEIFPTSRSQPIERERIRHIIQEHAGGETLELNQAFWVVRLYGDMRNEDNWHREQNVAKAAGFSPAEIAQYREAFVEADYELNGCLQQDEFVQVLDKELHLSLSQVGRLHAELQLLDEQSNSIDFAQFLRLVYIAKTDKMLPSV